MAMDLYLRSGDGDGAPSVADDGRPSLIPLRLPASLLASLTDESRLVIDHGAAESELDDAGDGAAAADGPSLTIATQDGSGKQSRDTFPLDVAEQDRPTEYYQSTTAQMDGSSTRKEIRSVGRTNKQYTLRGTSTTDLKEIGKKTRMLLEEERKKRKEIVRLDDSEMLPLPEMEAVVGQKPPPPADTDKAPPKKTGIKAAINPRKRKRQVASNVDGWMPNVEDLISDATTKDDRSNIVRLHGLPVGAKPEHIRKFFHGLNPSLIFVLPSFASHIGGWDAEYDIDGRDEAIVQRHSSNFRVFVKFASALVADMAMGRSGESISFDGERVTCKKRGVVGASISLSLVPKHVAILLNKHMAIHSKKGEAIMDTLAKSEQRMGTVTNMAWQMTLKRLRLTKLICSRGDGLLARLSKEYSTPKDRAQYIKLAKIYNQLIDTHEKLEVDSSLLLTHTFNPSCLEDSAHRITQAVSDWMLDEIYSIERLLKEARQGIDVG